MSEILGPSQPRGSVFLETEVARLESVNAEFRRAADFGTIALNAALDELVPLRKEWTKLEAQTARLTNAAALLRAENAELREALRAGYIMDGKEAMILTANGIPMHMPKRQERIVRLALQRIESEVEEK